MPDADGRMTRDEMEDAEEIVALSAKIAMIGAAVLASPALSFVWGRARSFWMGQINVLGLDSLLANMGYVGLLGVTAVSAVTAAEALWHGHARRARPGLVMHLIALVASTAVAIGVVLQTYRWLFDADKAILAFIVYMALMFALLGLAGLIYNLVKGMRTQAAIDRAIRAALKG